MTGDSLWFAQKGKGQQHGEVEQNKRVSQSPFSDRSVRRRWRKKQAHLAKAGKQPLSSISTLQVKHIFQPLYRQGQGGRGKQPLTRTEPWQAS